MRWLKLFVYIYMHVLAALCALIASIAVSILLAIGLTELSFNRFIVFVLSYGAFFLTLITLVYGSFILIEKLLGNWFRRGIRIDQEDQLRCLNCNYDLRGTPREQCPECGTAISWTRQQKIKKQIQEHA